MQRPHRQSGTVATASSGVSRRATRRAWLGTILLLLLQVQLATHLEFDHTSTAETAGTCEVCLQLDSNGHAPLPTADAFALVHARDSLPSATLTDFFSPDTLGPRARAPPLS